MPPTTAAYKKGGFAKIDNSIVQTESRIEKARIRIMKWHFTWPCTCITSSIETAEVFAHVGRFWTRKSR